MASLEIVLDEPTRTYVTGDTVKGNVVVTRDTGFAGGSAALKFTSFKLTCTSELVLRPHTGLIEMIANTGGPNNVTLMHEEVDFTRGGSIVSIDSSGSDQMSSDVGAPRVKGKAAYFPFEVALQPADNVRNGLLDSFHGKTIGIAFVIRSEMRRPTMFKSVLEDAIELVVESAVDTGNAASVRIDEKRQAFALSTSADKLAGKTGQGSSVTCTGFIDSGVFEAGSAITGDVELALRLPPTEQNHTQGSESAARVSGNEPARAGDEASTNSGASGTQSAPYEEKTVSLKMAISVVETIVNSSGGSSGGGSKTGGGTKSEDTHLACEVIIADKVLLTTGDATSSTRLPLHVLLPRLHTCPSFALDNLCSVAFSVQLTLIEHASQAAAGDMSKTNSDKVSITTVPIKLIHLRPRGQRSLLLRRKNLNPTDTKPLRSA